VIRGREELPMLTARFIEKACTNWLWNPESARTARFCRADNVQAPCRSRRAVLRRAQILLLDEAKQARWNKAMSEVRCVTQLARNSPRRDPNPS